MSVETGGSRQVSIEDEKGRKKCRLCFTTTQVMTPWILFSRIGPFAVGYSQRNSISHSHLDTNRNIISFVFFLSFFGRDEDYVTIYLKKILYLSFSHKYILKIILFFLLVFKELTMCLVQIKKSINLQVFSSMLEL